jgi:hypothetical protein
MTTVEILDSSLNRIAVVKNLYPINEEGMVLRYSGELSDYGFCTFRIPKNDPLFSAYGDVIMPHQYHIRVREGNTIVWKGAIVDNPSRNRYYQEVKAAQYLFYLDKVLVKRTSAVSYGGTAPSQDIGLHYRIFSSGTMAAAVSTLITEVVATLGSGHVLSGLVAGTIDSPDFPSNFIDSNGDALTGPLTFSSDFVMQFDYHSVLYILKQFGLYANCDFEIDESLNLNFETFLGTKRFDLTFLYGTTGNIVDYDLPRYGSRVTNDLVGISTTPDGVILHAEKTDDASKGTFGLLQGAAAFADVKDANALTARLTEQLRLTSSPEVSPVNLVLNERSYPIGQWDAGDIVTVKIVDGAIDYFAPRRIVGYTVNQHNTGRKLTTVQTNAPRSEDLGA